MDYAKLGIQDQVHVAFSYPTRYRQQEVPPNLLTSTKFIDTYETAVLLAGTAVYTYLRSYFFKRTKFTTSMLPVRAY
eukprot:SAG31_NODE_299_length_18114_cov_3.533777_11_plen_77_part_00